MHSLSLALMVPCDVAASDSWLPAMQLIVAKLKEKDPAVAASVSKIELMVSPFAACDSS